MSIDSHVIALDISLNFLNDLYLRARDPILREEIVRCFIEIFQGLSIEEVKTKLMAGDWL